VDIKHGTHVADAESLTVRAAGMLWLATGEENGLERSTRTRNKQHLDLQIIPFIGATKLNKLTVPAVRTFETTLRTNGRSPALTRMVL
jgi:integrase